LRSFEAFDALLVHFIVCSALDGEEKFSHHDVYRNTFFESQAYLEYKNEPRMKDQRAVLAKGHQMEVPLAAELSSVGQQSAVYHTESLVQFGEIRQELREMKQYVLLLTQQLTLAIERDGRGAAGDGLASVGNNQNGIGGSFQITGCMPGLGGSAVAGFVAGVGVGAVGAAGGVGTVAGVGAVAVTGVGAGNAAGSKRPHSGSANGAVGGVGRSVNSFFVKLPLLSTIKFGDPGDNLSGCQFVVQLFLGVRNDAGELTGLGMQPKPLRDQGRGWKTAGKDLASRLEAVWNMILNVRGREKVFVRNSSRERVDTLNAATKIDVVVASTEHQNRMNVPITNMGEFVKLVMKDSEYRGSLKEYCPDVKRRPKDKRQKVTEV
jgi:hypothetical protein